MDTAARIGGDELAVLLPDTSAAEAATVMQRVEREYLRRCGERGWKLGLSIGLAAADVADTDSAAVLARADSAMYAAKAQRTRRGT